MLFAIDGKTDEFAIFECSCRQYSKRTPLGEWLVGTNHYCSLPMDENSESSESRYERLEGLITTLVSYPDKVNIPADLIAILADPQVEAHEENFGTVCANLACPGTGQVWHTFGGFPAASKGDWHQIDWPWKLDESIQP
jgi:hypothetical protein